MAAYYGGSVAAGQAAAWLVRLLPPGIAAGRARAVALLLGSLAQLLLVAALMILLLSRFRPRPPGLFPLEWRPLTQWDPPLTELFTAFMLAAQIAGLLLPTSLRGPQAAAAGAAAAAPDPDALFAQQIMGSRDWTARGLLLLAAGLCGPVTEEVVFRGFLLPSLQRYLPAWGAVLASAAAFSAGHPSLAWHRLLQGVLYGAVFVRAGNLWPPILLHCAWNCLAVLAACLPRLVLR